MAKDYSKYTIKLNGKTLKNNCGKRSSVKEVTEIIFSNPDIDFEKRNIFYLQAQKNKWLISSDEFYTAQKNKEDKATRFFETQLEYENQKFHFFNQWEVGNFSVFLDTIKEIFGDYFEFVPEETANDDSLENSSETKQKNETDNSLINEIKNLLLASGQIILTGAPGTGKTYLAKEVAKLITGDNKDTPEDQSHIAFVQFHPSYDYTDFVEGLRPVSSKDESGTIGFERKDGIFKEFCKKALKNYQDSKKSVQEIKSEENAQEKINSFLNDAIENQKIFATVNKNQFSINSFDDDNISIYIPGNNIKKEVSVPYNELLKIIADNLTLQKPGDVKTIFNKVHNRQHDSYLYVMHKEIRKIKKDNSAATREKIALQNFVFIIDEINRGDISKIFGELFYAIDSGYRGIEGKVQTQYHNLLKNTNDLYKDGFYIPENVYIIGTMNDIDRSVESMDFAIRRRFTWKEIKAEDRISMWDGKIDKWKNEAEKRMNSLNNEISKPEFLGSNAFHIGPAYFLKINGNEINFDNLWELHIQPLLKEYLRGMPEINTALEKLKKAYDLKLNASEQNDKKDETVTAEYKE